MSELCILDRWEGDIGVIEITDEADRTRWQQVARSALPPQAREGDVLVSDGRGWRLDAAATAARREKMARRLARLNGRQTPPEPGK